MAEQRERDKLVNHRADIFTAGLILNEMFTGKIVYGRDYDEIGSIALGFAYLDSLMARMLQSSPEKRYQSIDEIQKEIQTRTDLGIA